MARSFVGLLNSMAREAAKQQRRAEVDRRREVRARIQEERDLERGRLRAAKEARQQYLDDRIAEAEDRTQELTDCIRDLVGVLETTLRVNDTISFESLRSREPAPFFRPDPKLTEPLRAPVEEEFLARVAGPSWLGRRLPGGMKRYEEALERQREEFRQATVDHGAREADRQRVLAQALHAHEIKLEAHREKVARHNAEVDEFEEAYLQADPKAVSGYVSMVLERSDYPENFPREFRVAFAPASQELIVEYELPSPDIVPAVAEIRYVKTKDAFEEKPRKASEIKDLYQDLVAAIALRTCHEAFESDQAGHLAVVTFNGFVQAVDPSTGRDIRPCLISVRVSRDRFLEIDLGKVDKKACLRNLGAQLSPRPYEVQPVKPIVEFDMVDGRFVEQSDILGDLESRPNLLDLTPLEFENLVSNLFGQLGLETRLTRSSRDGGVDVVAYDARPVLGGKVVIQAKRYRNTVGVAAVRDLFGTMMNEGANKGILVTTSGFGPDAFDFACDKPIELLDGGRLLYLLDQIGVQARIIFPNE
jgi:restriction system protein